jgi:hypothetical protein
MGLRTSYFASDIICIVLYRWKRSYSPIEIVDCGDKQKATVNGEKQKMKKVDGHNDVDKAYFCN